MMSKQKKERIKNSYKVLYKEMEVLGIPENIVSFLPKEIIHVSEIEFKIRLHYSSSHTELWGQTTRRLLLMHEIDIADPVTLNEVVSAINRFLVVFFS